MKKLFSIFALFLSFCSFPTVAMADTVDEQRSLLYARMNELGVSPDYQDSLVEVILAGGIPLSNPDAIPISQSAQLVSGYQEIRFVYADGSVQVKRIQQPRVNLSRASILGCSLQSGTGYRNYSNCLINSDTVSTHFGFYANYGLYVGGKDSITSVYDPFIFCFFGACSEPNLVITKKYEDSNGPATAKLSTVFTLVGGGISSTTSISLQVGNDSAKVVVK